MAPRPGGWAAGGGGGWKYHLSLPSRPFLQLGPLKKPPLASSSRVPGQSLSPRGLFHDPGNTNSGALPPCAPLSASPGVPSRLPAPRVSPSPRLGPESRKTRSLPPIPRVRAAHPRAVPTSSGPARPLASWKGEGRCQLGPRPSAPSPRGVPASRTAAPSCSGLREQVRAAAAWRAPAPRPGGGREGARGGACLREPCWAQAPALRSPPAPGRCAFPRNPS